MNIRRVETTIHYEGISQLNVRTMVLREENRGKEDEKTITETRENTFNSPDEFRKNLVREYFHSSIDVLIGMILLSATGSFAYKHLDIKTGLLAMGIAGMCSALYISEQGSNEPFVQSRMESFHKHFPNLKPIRFNPIDYLKTFRIQ